MIGIVDYGRGNIGSLRNALNYIGISSIFSHDPSELVNCKGLILPGVGAFPPAMERLQSLGLSDFLKEWAHCDQPLLGICLGMQLLLSKSEENGQTAGLNIIPGEVIKISKASRAIHIGWNTINLVSTNNIVPAKLYGYFVHSYACQMYHKETIVGETHYGIPFASVVKDRSVMGVQFHPEKSQSFGLSILKGFANGDF